MNSRSSREREDEGHLNQLADSLSTCFRGIEPHSVQRIADSGFEKNVIGADEADARGLDAASLADHEECDDLPFDPGGSQTVGISRRPRAVPERHLSLDLPG